MGQSEKRVEIVLIYLLLVFGGIFAIYLIHCRVYMFLKDSVSEAAEEIKNEGEIEDYENYLPGSLFLYSEQGIEEVHCFVKQKDFDFAPFIESVSSYYDSRSSVYSLPGKAFPFSCVALAGAPLYDASGRFQGELFICYYLEYLTRICLGYVGIVSFVFVFVAYTLIRERKNRAIIEVIYHQYVANISHELKTPIASIQAITETLSEGLAKDEVTRSRYYGIISREARQLEHSVLQIIELSKLQDDRIEYKKERVSPHALLDTIEERFSARCEELGIRFYIHESVWELPDFYTDAFRIGQLLEILLDNAYKFVDEDGCIFIDATRRHGVATLRVNDDGRGISDDDLPHIFERFYKTKVDNPTGSGLGLAIAREIAEGLKQQIWVRSKEGEGTIFFITVETCE